MVYPDISRKNLSFNRILFRWLADYVEELLERADQYKQKHEPGTIGIELDDDIHEDFMTPWQKKKSQAEKLAKKHEEKHQWYLKMKKRKLMEQEQQETKERVAKKNRKNSGKDQLL